LLHLHLPVTALLILVLAHTLLNAATAWRLGRPRPVTETELFCHLLADLALFGALLFISGGATNPFAFLLLLPLTISAAALSTRWTWLMAALAIALYSLLMLLDRTWAEASAHGFHLHVLGMWLGFVLSAGLIAYFVARMGNALRERELHLLQVREQILRDERMVALGALAAGAAHELGTPLATIAVIADELLQERRDSGLPDRHLQLMRGQIERCKNVLAELAERAGETPAAAGRKQRLQAYLDRLVDDWQQQHPGVTCIRTWQGVEAGPWIVADLTLDQALRNLINNAADASPWRVEICARWSDDDLQLQIRDQGDGFSPESLPALGQRVYSTKAKGRGLGLLLAQSVLTRFGGRIAFRNGCDGGAVVDVALPLQRIRVA
jgi:two-component system sensor histidine kinase RegB